MGCRVRLPRQPGRAAHLPRMRGRAAARAPAASARSPARRPELARPPPGEAAARSRAPRSPPARTPRRLKPRSAPRRRSKPLPASWQAPGGRVGASLDRGPLRSRPGGSIQAMRRLKGRGIVNVELGNPHCGAGGRTRRARSAGRRPRPAEPPTEPPRPRRVARAAGPAPLARRPGRGCVINTGRGGRIWDRGQRRGRVDGWRAACRGSRRRVQGRIGAGFPGSRGRRLLAPRPRI
jgi:hypothetical protein